MYNSPIEIIYKNLEMQLDGEIMKAVQNIGVQVDKEELMKALKYDRDQYSKGYEDGLSANKWISVSERVPKDNETVIFCTKEGMVESGTYDAKKNWCSNDSYFPNAFCFVAWMPLPEPYKEV